MHSGDDDPGSASSSSDIFLLGFLTANIVGQKHYDGWIRGRALVALLREPHNSHDPNAIQVLNIHGHPVGYIERAVAAVLSPLIDDNLITVEGIVPDSRMSYRTPCQIHIFAHLYDFDAVKDAVSRSSLRLVTESEAAFALSDSAAVKATKAEKRSMSVDAIFDLVNSNLANKNRAIDMLEPPRSIIKTELFPHQKEGLAWLVRHEKADDMPPFWEEIDGKFINILTDYQTDRRPEPLRGGIVADEMGLGKTLTLLSLIAFDKRSQMSVSKKWRTDRKSVTLGKRCRNEDECSLQTGMRTNATLVVCPPSVMSVWITQLEDHTVPGALKTYMYYGERTKNIEELKKYDLVLTTYTTLSGESGGMPAKQMEWRRIILDEAHNIKNFSAKVSKVIFGLNGQYRWAVTGTPIQSGCLDLFSIMVFLRFDPFSERKYWRRLVQRPLDQGQEKGLTRLQVLMEAIALRRTKDMALVSLPPKTVEICYVQLSREERQLYDQEKGEIMALLRSIRSRTTREVSEYTAMLSSILRLRQICTNSKLCQYQSLCNLKDLAGVSYNPELLQTLLGQLQDGEDFECPICLSPPTDIVITLCAHVFCRGCILRSIEHKNSSGCPLCRRKISESDLLSPSPESSETESDELSAPSKTHLSSKVSTLIKLLKESRDQHPGVKSVVYSQFRKLLLLLEEPLNAAGFKTVRLDGTMNAKDRANVIEQFQVQESNSPTVLLASLRASSAGINLTAASRLYFMEPWWNHAVEEQAMDRVHRIGQKEPVKIVRFIAQDSIEEKILMLQEKKKQLSGREEPSETGSNGMGVNDMRFLLE